MAAFAVLLFCHLYFSTVMSEDWFLNARSYSKTPYEAIKHHLQTLNAKGIESGSYSLLSVDEKHNNLLVGARNHALLVDLDNIDSYVLWNVTKPSSSVTCDKNKDVLCNNFIKVMLPFDERIFLCWTGRPPTAACSWRNRTDLSDAPGKDNLGNVFKTEEEYRVPILNPDENDTTVIAGNGTLFTGTKNPISTGKSMIYSMSFKKPEQRLTYTSLSDQSWFFTDVQFVKSFDIGHYVYFFFRERTLECSSCGKSKVSRVARICKGDYGGKNSLDNVFVTFQKAKLSCSDGKDYPVNFNEIQDVWFDKPTELFHAVFTSHPNGPPSTAICIYSLSAINQVFDDSSFKSFESDDKHWSLVDNKHKEFFQNCKVNTKYIDSSNSEAVPAGMMATRKMTSDAYRQLMHDPLMADSVEPTNSQAWFIKDGIRMTAITLEKVASNTVVYTSTDRGSVLKIAQSAESNQPCLLAEMNLFPDEKKEIIKSMALDTNRHFLYLGSKTTLAKLSLEQCSSFLDESSCISAADPYCGWDVKTRSCVSVLSHGKPSELKQDLSTCPKVKDVGWSPWKTCIQNDGNLCRCKVRPCQDKQNSSCEGGLEYRLENCTVDVSVGWEGTESWEALGVQHGNWSIWGNWSECSAKVWAGVKNRSRTCTNPVPRRGGRPCGGEAVQYKPCSLGVEDVGWSPWKTCIQNDGNLCRCKVRPCRDKQNSSCEGGLEYRLENCTVDVTVGWEGTESWEALGVQHGNWSIWGNWSECSAKAWAGVKNRSRTCTNPAPRRGGRPCAGEAIQYKPCSLGVEDVGWSPWKTCIQNDGNLCRCKVRPCRDKQNSSCEGGLEYRLENCTVDVSVGWEGTESWEALGVQHGNWSIWGNWSECSAKAWAGVKNRSRTCTNPVPRRGGRPCVGEAVQYESCSLGIEVEEKSLRTDDMVVNCSAKGYKITDIGIVFDNKLINITDGGNRSWDDWSDCVCDHELEGIENCFKQTGFHQCSPKLKVDAVGVRVGPKSLHNSNFGIGHVIGAAVIGCVFTVTLCIAAICYVNHRRKQINVSRAEENSLQDACNESKYATIPKAENVELFKDPSTPENRDKKRNSRIKTPSPLNILFTKRRQNYPVDAV